MRTPRTLLKLGMILAAIAAGILAQSTPTPEPPQQPIPFSHKLHITQGLQCQTCHSNPAPGDKMTLPATAKCMSCHADIATEQSSIKTLADFHQKKETVPWVRIYQLPDWVWFSHRTHLATGAKCDRCHGAVQERIALWKEKPLTMESCMNCHRETNASNACNLCHEAH